MAKDREVKYNGSGYYDPTPYEAIKRIEGGSESRRGGEIS